MILKVTQLLLCLPGSRIIPGTAWVEARDGSEVCWTEESQNQLNWNHEGQWICSIWQTTWRNRKWVMMEVSVACKSTWWNINIWTVPAIWTSWLYSSHHQDPTWSVSLWCLGFGQMFRSRRFTCCSKSSAICAEKNGKVEKTMSKSR